MPKVAEQTIFSPDEFGALHDVESIWDKSTVLAAGVDIITINKGWHFTFNDEHKQIQIAGVGVAHGPHTTTIAQVMSSNQIRISDATITATPTSPVQDTWLRLDYGTDDSDAVQEAIDSAEAVNGGVVLSLGTYWTTRPMVISKSIVFRGEGVLLQNGSYAEHGTHSLDMPMESPYLRGSVLLQTAPNTDGLQIRARGVSVSLRHFGIRFSEGTRFRCTGDAINQCAPDTGEGHPDNGILGGIWEGLAVFGTDGNHNSILMVNPLYTVLMGINVFGGGFKFVASSISSNSASYGGMTILGCYSHTPCGGTEGPWKFEAINTLFGNNYFARPQGTVAGHGFTSDPTSAQPIFTANPVIDIPGVGKQGNYGLVLGAPDMESNVGSVVDIPDSCIGEIGPGIIPGEPLGKSPKQIGGPLIEIP